MSSLTPPIAKKIPYKFTVHNITHDATNATIEDDYHWLRDENWPDVNKPEILAYLKTENDYFSSIINPMADKVEEILTELKGRIKLTDQSVYIKRDDFYYYVRTEEDKDYPIYCRKEGNMEAKEKILLDVNKLAAGKNFTTIGSFAISSAHNLMAYSVDHNGSERYNIHIFDLVEGKYLPDEIPDTIGGIVWHEQINGFFYTPTDEKWRHDKVKCHILGTNYLDDKVIFHDGNPLYEVSITKSASRKYFFINVQGHNDNEIYYIDGSDFTLTPHLLKTRADNVFYSAEYHEGYFYINTNAGAKNFHILRTKRNHYDEQTSKWEIYINEETDKYLVDFEVTKNFLLLGYKIMGLSQGVVHRFSDGRNQDKNQNIKFPEPAFTARIYSTNYYEDDIRIDYSSLARPQTTYSYDFTTDNLTILKTQEIPGGFNEDEYKVERIFAETDGVFVPISLFYKKSLFKQDGSNPLYLYGYGSYGLSIAPSFRNAAISLVNRGFVYAIAHIRGGDDLGHDWYEAAKFLNKEKTFQDFIAVTKKLISEKYTSSGNIAIMGGSAGGMLIGNVINQCPHLYKLAIAHVPFVDVLNTMLDGSLPLTPQEYKEWGNPQEAEYFTYIRSYSPYDNVKEQDYPHLLVTAGISDPRVGYWEAAKWVAKLRDKKTDQNLLIYKTNMDSGHGGKSGRFDALKETAEELAFIFKIFGKMNA